MASLPNHPSAAIVAGRMIQKLHTKKIIDLALMKFGRTPGILIPFLFQDYFCRALI
jgi:hypothetical protein